IPGADAVKGQDVQQVAVLPGAVAVGDQVAGGGYAQDEGPQHQEGPVEPAAVEGDEGAGRLADVAPELLQDLDLRAAVDEGAVLEGAPLRRCRAPGPVDGHQHPAAVLVGTPEPDGHHPAGAWVQAQPLGHGRPLLVAAGPAQQVLLDVGLQGVPAQAHRFDVEDEGGQVGHAGHAPPVPGGDPPAAAPASPEEPACGANTIFTAPDRRRSRAAARACRYWASANRWVTMRSTGRSGWAARPSSTRAKVCFTRPFTCSRP